MLINLSNKDRQNLKLGFDLLSSNDVREISFSIQSRVLHIYSVSYTGFAYYINIVLPKAIPNPLQFTTPIDTLNLLATTKDEPVRFFLNEDFVRLVTSSFNIKVPTTITGYSLDDCRELMVCNLFELIDIPSILNLSKAVDSLRDKAFEKYILLQNNSLLTHSMEFVVEASTPTPLMKDYLINYYMLSSLKRLQKFSKLHIGKNDTRVIFRLDNLYFSFNYIDLNVGSILEHITEEFKFVASIEYSDLNRLSIFSLLGDNLNQTTLSCSSNIVTFKSSDENTILLYSNGITELPDLEIPINLTLIDKAKKFLSTKQLLNISYNKVDNIIMLSDSQTKLIFRGGE